jgi:pseudouridine 5'-phosphatase
LVFEDASNGIEAARAAGMHSIWVPDKELLNVLGGDSKDLGFGEDELLASLEDFVPEKYGLPAYHILD